jgi:hypothetical protein
MLKKISFAYLTDCKCSFGQYRLRQVVKLKRLKFVFNISRIKLVRFQSGWQLKG